MRIGHNGGRDTNGFATSSSRCVYSADQSEAHLCWMAVGTLLSHALLRSVQRRADDNSDGQPTAPPEHHPDQEAADRATPAIKRPARRQKGQTDEAAQQNKDLARPKLRTAGQIAIGRAIGIIKAAGLGSVAWSRTTERSTAASCGDAPGCALVWASYSARDRSNRPA